MANVEQTVSIIFSGIDKTSSVISGVGKNLDQLSGKVQSVAQPFSDAADGVLKLDTALVTLAAAGIAVAVNQAGKFGDSFKEISTLIDDTGQGVEQFRTDILNYARDSGKSIEDIEAAIYTAISAGVSYNDSLKMLDGSEKLSIATKSGLESSTKLLASTLNAYGESTDQATKYSDILFTTVKNGQTTFPELSSSLASVLNIAANAGVPFETLSAAIAAVTATGAPTSQAITSIQSALANIIKPTSQATKLANELGIEFNASALKTEGFEKILWKVQEATGGSADKMAVLFGDVNGLSSAMTLGADVSGKFKDSLNAMANSAGATETAYKKMADNFKDTNQNLANNVRATFIQVGTELQDNYSDIVSGISEMFKSVGVSIDQGAFVEIFKALDGVGDDISKFFSDLAQSMPEALDGINWDGFLTALDKLGFSIGSLFDNFDPSDPESVRKAIQFVVDSLETLITVSKGMVDSFKPMIDALLNSVDAFNRMDDSDKEATGNVLALAKALTTLGTGLTTLMLLIGNNADSIEAAFNLIIGSIEVAWGGFKAGLQVISVAVLESIGTILAAVEKVTFGDWEDKIKTARSGVQQELDGLYTRLNQSVSEVHSGWDQIVEGVSQGVDQVKDRYVDLNATDVTVVPVFEINTFEENLAIVEGKMDEFNKSCADDEIVLTNTGALGAIDEVDRKWNALSLNSWGTLDVHTNFDQIQNDWNALNDEITAGGNGHTLEYKTIYKWTDADGGEHITDTPPDPGAAIGDVKEIKTPIKVDVDDKNIADTKNKIQQSFSQASMGDINLGFSFGAEGMGPVTDKLKDAVSKMEPIDMSQAFDMSGLSDLFEQMNSSSGLDKYKIQDAINQQLRLQEQAIDAQTRLTQAQAAVAENMVRAANVMWMTGEQDKQDKTIKIEASGLEPEMEAFMWKLLKKIQVRANESGAEFLLAAT